MTRLEQKPELIGEPHDREGLYVDQKQIVVSGKLFRTARLLAEGCEFVGDPVSFISKLKRNGAKADLFTFRQRPSEREPKFDYPMERESLAILPIDSYEKWWKTQIKDKTRNMVRKAGKKGVILQSSELTDEFVSGISTIYNECSMRQGKPFRHYGKDLATLRREHSSFLHRSEFIGAYCEGRMVGFAKVVYDGDFAILMNIISLISERDKAPTNALIARAVERCAQRGVGLLQYGTWSRRSFGDFKLHHGFKCVDIPRYYIPLNYRGRLMLSLGLIKDIGQQLPAAWVDRLVDFRARWYSIRNRKVAN